MRLVALLLTCALRTRARTLQYYSIGFLAAMRATTSPSSATPHNLLPYHITPHLGSGQGVVPCSLEFVLLLHPCNVRTVVCPFVRRPSVRPSVRLLATVGLGQVKDDFKEPPILTAGEEFSFLDYLLIDGAESYSALDVIKVLRMPVGKIEALG